MNINMNNAIAKQILDLETKSIYELRAIYGKLYCKETKSNARQQLIQKIACRLQELEYGFLPDKYTIKLDSMANEMAKGKKFKGTMYFKPVSGTKLCREYNGAMLEVDTIADGFIFNGKIYKSLSAIAREITGTRWNGLKFFGLKK